MDHLRGARPLLPRHLAGHHSQGRALAPYWRELAALAVFNVVVLGLATLRLAKEEG